LSYRVALLLLWLPLSIGRVAAAAGELQLATPESVGFDSERLQRLDAVMQTAVDDKDYAGAVVLLARHGKVVHYRAYGEADSATHAPLKKDAIFRIFSMSKPVTAAAMMVLYEEGKWNPQDPLYSVIPEFAHLKVYKKVDASGALVAEDPEHSPTLRELMTHTAGFSYGWSDNPVDHLYRGPHGGSIFTSDSLQTLIEQVAKAPLRYQPGTRWVYSLSADIQGYVIEKLSGMKLPEFMQKRLFEPLRMRDTAFHVPAQKQDRLPALYRMNNDGQLAPANPILEIHYDREPSLPEGGAGLVSTASDYFRFAQMLLNGGVLDGVRILAPQTVKLMMSNHLSDGVSVEFNDGPMRPGMGYGFDGAVVVDASKADVPLGNGSYLWDGAAGTWFWVDPVNDIVFVGMVQRLGWTVRTPDRKVPPNLEELSHATCYQALVRPNL
jgi:CubicO group peptidase (beta-lactamase class C family)